MKIEFIGFTESLGPTCVSVEAPGLMKRAKVRIKQKNFFIISFLFIIHREL
jgi:hypothetical protein